MGAVYGLALVVGCFVRVLEPCSVSARATERHSPEGSEANMSPKDSLVRAHGVNSVRELPEHRDAVIELVLGLARLARIHIAPGTRYAQCRAALVGASRGDVKMRPWRVQPR